jgi:hypothetical protein
MQIRPIKAVLTLTKGRSQREDHAMRADVASGTNDLVPLTTEIVENMPWYKAWRT